MGLASIPGGFVLVEKVTPEKDHVSLEICRRDEDLLKSPKRVALPHLVLLPDTLCACEVSGRAAWRSGLGEGELSRLDHDQRLTRWLSVETKILRMSASPIFCLKSAK